MNTKEMSGRGAKQLLVMLAMSGALLAHGQGTIYNNVQPGNPTPATPTEREVTLKAKFVEIGEGGKSLGEIWTIAGMTNRPASNLGTEAAVIGILTYAQSRSVITALEQQDGTKVLTAPEVTTESGRQAQMQSVEIHDFDRETGGTGSVTAGRAFWPTKSTLTIGPEIDVVPNISADEFAVQMALTINITNFVGYDNPGAFVPQASVPAGGTITTVLPKAGFQVRQVVTNATIWDAQTVVLKLPPGSQAQTNNPGAKKLMLVFVTATIVNPDGTRYHVDEEFKGPRFFESGGAGSNR